MARLCASQAPAARGSTVPPLPPTRQRIAKHRVKQDPRTLGADGHLELAVAGFGADIEAAAADQRVARQEREVEEQFHRTLGQFLRRRPPSQARSAVPARTCPRARPSPRSYRSPRRSPPAAPNARRKNLSLLADARALSASNSRHFSRMSGILLVGQQLDPVVERTDGRHQIVAEPRAKQTGEIDGVHRRAFMGRSLTSRKFALALRLRLEANGLCVITSCWFLPRSRPRASSRHSAPRRSIRLSPPSISTRRASTGRFGTW